MICLLCVVLFMCWLLIVDCYLWFVGCCVLFDVCRLSLLASCLLCVVCVSFVV